MKVFGSQNLDEAVALIAKEKTEVIRESIADVNSVPRLNADGSQENFERAAIRPLLNQELSTGLRFKNYQESIRKLLTVVVEEGPRQGETDRPAGEQFDQAWKRLLENRSKLLEDPDLREKIFGE